MILSFFAAQLGNECTGIFALTEWVSVCVSAGNRNPFLYLCANENRSWTLWKIVQDLRANANTPLRMFFSFVFIIIIIDQFSELSRKNNFCLKWLLARCITWDCMYLRHLTIAIRAAIVAHTKCIVIWLIECVVSKTLIWIQTNDSLVYLFNALTLPV